MRDTINMETPEAIRQVKPLYSALKTDISQCLLRVQLYFSLSPLASFVSLPLSADWCDSHHVISNYPFAVVLRAGVFACPVDGLFACTGISRDCELLFHYTYR